MSHDSGGLWPHDPEALNGKRFVDDLELPEDLMIDVNPGYTVDPDAEPDAEKSETDEWGDDADNRLVDLGEDDPDVEVDLNR